MKGAIKCMMCSTLVDLGQDYKMLAIEVPYENLFFHPACYTLLLEYAGGWEGLPGYLGENTEMWLG